MILEINENSSSEWSSQGESVGQKEKCSCTWSPHGGAVVKVLGDAALPSEVTRVGWGRGLGTYSLTLLAVFPLCFVLMLHDVRSQLACHFLVHFPVMWTHIFLES